MLAEVREHVHIVREAMRGLRKLRIAREVSCRSSGNVTAKPNGAPLLGKGPFPPFPAGLYLTAKGLFFLCSSLLLHACIDWNKGWMGRGAPTPGWLTMHELVGWMGGSEMGPL